LVTDQVIFRTQDEIALSAWAAGNPVVDARSLQTPLKSRKVLELVRPSIAFNTPTVFVRFVVIDL
jgi:hypothetical protein